VRWKLVGGELIQTEVSNWFRRIGLTRSRIRWILLQRVARKWFLTAYFSSDQRREALSLGDPVRHGNFLLSFRQIHEDGIIGAIAECGVWRGYLSRFIRQNFPDRRLYLFDTFDGFDRRDSDTAGDVRFSDTSAEGVLQRISDTDDVVVRKGFFPETATGLESEIFALVIIDFDKYEPTTAALEFFYPRVSAGGFIFVHDYSSPESNWACSRALNEFLADKPELPILLPDSWGTALFRKI
jgi:O-methyltransferase